MPITSDDNLSLLIANGRISTLTIDTNIFDKNGINLNSGSLKALSGLKRRNVKFILTWTVSQEIIRHLKSNITEAFRSAKSAIGRALFAFQTEDPTRDNLLSQISGGWSAEKAAENQIDAFLQSTDCIVLRDMDLVEIKAVYDAYFSGAAPFARGGKKEEFPDALALNALENFSWNNFTQTIVVSEDRDWKDFCEKSSLLHIVPNIDHALDLITNAPIELRCSILSWLHKKQLDGAEISERVEQEISQVIFHVEGFATAGAMDAYASGWDVTNFELPEASDLNIIDIADQEPKYVIVSFPLEIFVDVDVELSFSTWDSIDRESIDLGGRSTQVTAELGVQATIKVVIFDFQGDNERMDLEDLEINLQSHTIELGGVDVYEPEFWREEREF